MELLVEGGLTPVQAIGAATLNVAKLYHFDRQYGSLEVGKVADFVVLQSDPTDDIKNTRSLMGVWMEGVEIDREGLLASPSRRGDRTPPAKSFVSLARDAEFCSHPFCHQH